MRSKSSKKHASPIGTFYCIGCDRHRKLGENLPEDWESPKWNEYDKVHDWRNYPSNDRQNEWSSFTDCQKKILAINFQCVADREHWD